jgi:hypothetical protein
MATFRVKQNGQPTEAWLADWMDATGNEGSFQVIDYGVAGHLVMDQPATAGPTADFEALHDRLQFSGL